MDLIQDTLKSRTVLTPAVCGLVRISPNLGGYRLIALLQLSHAISHRFPPSSLPAFAAVLFFVPATLTALASGSGLTGSCFPSLSRLFTWALSGYPSRSIDSHHCTHLPNTLVLSSNASRVFGQSARWTLVFSTSHRTSSSRSTGISSGQVQITSSSESLGRFRQSTDQRIDGLVTLVSHMLWVS
jgi:hypothetical protein